MPKLIQDLPWKIRFKLALLLDRQEPPNHNWKALIGELENLEITSIEVNAVERQGQIPGRSPTEVLLNTLEHRNYTLDDLYRGLHKMEHRQAMDIINKYGTHARFYKEPAKFTGKNYLTVSPEVKREIEEADLAESGQTDALAQGEASF